MFLAGRRARTPAGRAAPAGAGPDGYGRGGGARAPGSGDPPPPRRACAALPPRPARAGLGGASSLLRERGGGRAAKPGSELRADGVGAARWPREEPEKPRRLQEHARRGGACAGLPHPARGPRAAGKVRRVPRASEEVRPFGARPVLQPPGA